MLVGCNSSPEFVLESLERKVVRPRLLFVRVLQDAAQRLALVRPVIDGAFPRSPPELIETVMADVLAAAYETHERGDVVVCKSFP